MATFQHAPEYQGFLVVHPLQDAHEAKCETTNLDPIAMTRSVRLALMVLRGYLALMTLLLIWHVLAIAGAFHKLK